MSPNTGISYIRVSLSPTPPTHSLAAWNEFARSCRAVSHRGEAGNSSPSARCLSSPHLSSSPFRSPSWCVQDGCSPAVRAARRRVFRHPLRTSGGVVERPAAFLLHPDISPRMPGWMDGGRREGEGRKGPNYPKGRRR